MADPKILIVDDKPENLFALEKLLRRLEVTVVQATSGFDALDLTLQHDFCLAIVDVQMPEMDGYELVELIRSNQITSNLPVIFVSAIYSDEYHHRRGYEAGAVDFLSKPFVPEILLSKVKIFLDLYKQRRQLQRLLDEMDSTNTMLSTYTKQLEASNQVSQHITSILTLDTLLEEVVRLIQTQFDYYYVSIWLWDEAKENLTLQACASEIEGHMLDLGFNLMPKYANGVVGTVCRRGESYRVNDVTRNPRYMALRELPLTRSELALPLHIGSEIVLGALDIQSKDRSTFNVQDVNVLQALADQVAVAIRNAELYARVVHFNEELENKVQERTLELEQAYAHLELLDRNKSDFIQIVSHELRTPLTLVQGYGSILKRHPQYDLDEKCRQHVEGIVSGAERMHEIVNSMLDMVRIDNRVFNLVPEPVSLAALLDEQVQALAPAVDDRNLTLTIADMTGLPAIEADPEALQKLFDNLLTNAIKYTPDDGCIAVEAHLLEMDAPDAAPFIEVTVSDTGIGIAPEVRDLIFTKFYRTGSVNTHSSGKVKFKGGGPGLGLAIAKGIVEAHNGRIWVESPGYDEATCPGSQFHIVLPVQQNTSADVLEVLDSGHGPEDRGRSSSGEK